MRQKLTKRLIRQARYERESGVDYRWDTEMTGFGIRVYPSGRKSYVVTYRVRGKQRFMTLGPCGVLTMREARARGREILARARLGQDPSGERLEELRSPTMADLGKRYMEEHVFVHKKALSAKREHRTWERLILARLGRRKVRDVTRRAISALHSSLSRTPSMANATLKSLSKAFNLAEIWGWRPEGSNPCRHVQKFKRVKRERFLSDQELGRLSQALAEAERTRSESPQVVAALRLLILTGCRVGEILGLRWEDVDFERHCLHLPDSKTGPKTVYLNGPAVQLLAEIEPLGGNPYVLPGRLEGKHVASLQIPWKRIRRAARLEDVRVHDLRHSFASFGVGLGLPLQQVGKLLGHAQIATTERYAHLADDPIRRANERIGDHIWSVMSGQPKAEVVPIEGRGRPPRTSEEKPAAGS